LKRKYNTPEERLSAKRERQQALRRAAVAYLGGYCARCGMTDYRVLQIDHVDGGGSEEYRRIGQHGVQRRILRGAAGYQLLCANCHMLKTYYEVH
jgi:hypothetical protein